MPSSSSGSPMWSPVLEFKVDDIYKAPQIAQELENVAGSGFGSKNWMEQNQALFRALRLEKVVTFITIGLIVFVAALNILISLIMMVMEKTKDIAVLVSIGARRQQVRRIFMLQGVLVGVIGTLIGLDRRLSALPSPPATITGSISPPRCTQSITCLSPRASSMASSSPWSPSPFRLSPPSTRHERLPGPPRRSPALRIKPVGSRPCGCPTLPAGRVATISRRLQSALLSNHL